MSNILVKTEQLFTAIKDRRYSAAESLLKEGANPNRLLLNGVTPLHLAVAAESTSSFDYVKLLLNYKGNPNVCDADGITPLHVAAHWGKADCLALFLQNGGDLSLCDKEGRDINWFAKESEHCKFIIDEYVAALNESSDVDLSFVTNYSDMTPPTKKIFQTKIPLQEIDNNQFCNWKHFSKSEAKSHCINKSEQSNYTRESLHPSSSVGEKTGKYIMDATSPDHCFFVLKSNDDISKDGRKLLHDTLVIHKDNEKLSKEFSDLSLSNGTTPVSSLTDVEDKVPFKSKDDVYLTRTPDSQTVKLCSCCAASLSLTSFKSTSTDISVTSPSPNETKSNKCDDEIHHQSSNLKFASPPTIASDNLISHCMSDDMCRNMLLATKCAIGSVQNDIGNNNCRTPLQTTYETLPTLDSICTFADSTVSISERDISSDLERKNTEVPSSHDREMKCSLIEPSVKYEANLTSSYQSCLDESTLPIKLSLSTSVNDSNDDTILYDWQSLVDQSSFEEANLSFIDTFDSVTIPSHIENMDDKQLRVELLKHNYTPGPIHHGRKQYKKRLYFLEQGLKMPSSSGPRFSRELTSVLMGNSLPRSVVDDDESVRSEFDDPSQSARGGPVKDSFNYLLLDPRVTQNLPERVKSLSEAEALKVFAGATFYVGKGKKARPYAHLKEAIRDQNSKSKKIQHIHDIWKTDGVVSLHLFQNVLACEAFTREAAMIEALGLDHLTNHMRGKSYGAAHSWNGCRFRQYGAFLIIRAMQMLLLEGERHIRPHQISNKIDKTLKF